MQVHVCPIWPRSPCVHRAAFLSYGVSRGPRLAAAAVYSGFAATLRTEMVSQHHPLATSRWGACGNQGLRVDFCSVFFFFIVLCAVVMDGACEKQKNQFGPFHHLGTLSNEL